MKAWVTCFVILFGLVELVLWLKDFFLPLPIYLLGGAFLAIASNSSKGLGALFSQAGEHHETIEPPTFRNMAKMANEAKIKLSPRTSVSPSPAETLSEAPQAEATRVK